MRRERKPRKEEREKRNHFFVQLCCSRARLISPPWLFFLDAEHAWWSLSLSLLGRKDFAHAGTLCEAGGRRIEMRRKTRRRRGGGGELAPLSFLVAEGCPCPERAFPVEQKIRSDGLDVAAWCETGLVRRGAALRAREARFFRGDVSFFFLHGG